MISLCDDHVVYRIKQDDRDEPGFAQDISISINSVGAYAPEPPPTTVDGERVSLTSEHMIGRLVYLFRKRGAWPKVARLQA
jgi:hypothetical protein